MPKITYKEKTQSIIELLNADLIYSNGTLTLTRSDSELQSSL